MKTFIAFLIPGGVIFLAAIGFLRPDGLPEWIQGPVHALPFIVLGFGLFGSRFVLSPILPVGGDAGAGESIGLPSFSGASPGAVPASVVVSFRRSNTILFDGGMYTLRELGEEMTKYARAHPRAVMLVQVDKQVSVQEFAELCDLALHAGFAQVQLATQSPAPAEIPPGGAR